MTQTEQQTDWYSPEVATFGDRVAAAREAAQMDQSALARRLGVRTATLQGWENDTSEPRANRLATLAGVLNVSMMWLINGEGEGLDAPADQTVLPDGAEDLLAELNKIRLEMTASSKRLGQLEKRLRQMMKAPFDA
ncbi:helix-turn-helix transcriptional regulator [Sulfitobacter sp. HNIBRBA3233]|uniref:helix-turn-helix domain-containing protein n=1 Tax=Sulfitobacter marinivivus TaxID=3158558 RepID=UPI0032DE958A